MLYTWWHLFLEEKKEKEEEGDDDSGATGDAWERKVTSDDS